MTFEEWWDRHGRAAYQAGGRDPKSLAAMSWESALEEAARLCDMTTSPAGGGHVLMVMAAKIRALMGHPPQ